MDDKIDVELRVAFDSDGVITDDEAEAIYKRNNDVGEFHAHETEKALVPHRPGPLAVLIMKLSFMQKLEERVQRENPKYQPILRIAIVTA